MSPRAAAALSLALSAAAAVLVAILAASDFPRGVPVVLAVLAAAFAAWTGLVRRGRSRSLWLSLAALLLVASLVLIAVNGRVIEDAAVIACVVLAVTAARYAFAVHVALPSAQRPRHAVLFWNPRSGGGKATRFHLPDEARARDIEPIELDGGDLETLVRVAIAGGADALAMAGGDGSQAVVARLAAEHELPYACIPAGTRNHFALDLGVDRDDVVGALDALVDGGERRVDLAEVNGRVFVNNVSLGVYADAVQRPEYRDAKLRTIVSTFPDSLGSENGDSASGLHWTGPAGTREGPAPALLVSNNAYRLGRAVGSGTRPHVDAGVLGITVFDPPGHAPSARPWREWTARRFEVGSDRPVNAGIDGEAAVLAPPLRFASRPGVLRVRVARAHPGASPSSGAPEGVLQVLAGLVHVARGSPLPEPMNERSSGD
jgi:diacylglycerol kinase family enzyme